LQLRHQVDRWALQYKKENARCKASTGEVHERNQETELDGALRDLLAAKEANPKQGTVDGAKAHKQAQKHHTGVRLVNNLGGTTRTKAVAVKAGRRRSWCPGCGPVRTPEQDEQLRVSVLGEVNALFEDAELARCDKCSAERWAPIDSRRLNLYMKPLLPELDEEDTPDGYAGDLQAPKRVKRAPAEPFDAVAQLQSIITGINKTQDEKQRLAAAAAALELQANAAATQEREAERAMRGRALDLEERRMRLQEGQLLLQQQQLEQQQRQHHAVSHQGGCGPAHSTYGGRAQHGGAPPSQASSSYRYYDDAELAEIADEHQRFHQSGL
jgi:hypothetical protein